MPGPLMLGLRCRCPRCGQGRLYSRFLVTAERCSHCGLDLKRADSGDGPAVFLIFLLGFLVVPIALKVAMSVDWPLWLHGVVWGALILGLTIGLLQPAKGVLIALQYQHRRSEFDA